MVLEQPHPRFRLSVTTRALIVGAASVLLFLWQYTVISNVGIIPQPWNSTFSGFSYIQAPHPLRQALAATAPVAWFPVCSLVARTMDYPEGSGHWMVRVRHAFFRLGLVPPPESHTNGLPLAVLNTAVWLLVLLSAYGSYRFLQRVVLPTDA
jgi:hypothetical protein